MCRGCVIFWTHIRKSTVGKVPLHFLWTVGEAFTLSGSINMGMTSTQTLYAKRTGSSPTSQFHLKAKRQSVRPTYIQLQTYFVICHKTKVQYNVQKCNEMRFVWLKLLINERKSIYTHNYIQVYTYTLLYTILYLYIQVYTTVTQESYHRIITLIHS